MDEVKLQSENFKRICRICMDKNEKLIDIFSSSTGYSTISNAIMECAPVQVALNDSLPPSICDLCVGKLDQAYRFRVLCVQSDLTLRQILLHQEEISVKAEIEDEVKEEFKYEEDDSHFTCPIPELIDAERKSDPYQIENIFQTNTDIISVDLKARKPRPKKLKTTLPDENGLFSCEKCSSYFKRRYHLERHQKRCLTNTIKNRKKTKTVSNEIEKQIVSPPVKRMKLYGPNKANIVLQPDGRFSCRVCDKSYKSKYHVARHALVHSDIRFNCPECNKGFTRLRNLQIHIKIHTGERTYSCEFCGKTFRQDTALLKHRRIHLGVKPYKCDVCQRTFTQNKTLKNHTRTHTGERPFVCETCGRNFNRKHILKTHMMTHTGERPYKCELCGQGFICKQHLQLHYANHNSRPSTSYRCDICQKEFTNAALKKKHEKLHKTVEQRNEISNCK